MAAEIDGIGIELDLKTDKVKKGLEQIDKIAVAAAKRIEVAFRGANKKVGNMGDTARKNVVPALKQVNKSTVKARKSLVSYNRQLEATKRKSVSTSKASRELSRAMKGFLGVASGVFVAKKFARASDEVLRFRGTLKSLLTDSEQVLPIIEKRMLSMSATAGVSFKSTSKLFNRIAIIKNDLNASNKEILTFVGNVQKIGVATGASAEGLKFGTTQLAQGLTSGVFRAEELNSILENMPGVAKAISDNMGKSVAQMRQMVLNGELMSKDVFNALNKESEKYNKNLDNMPLTWDRAGARASVAFTAIASQIEDATGLSETFANIWANIFTETAFATGALRPVERIEESIIALERANDILGSLKSTPANISLFGEREETIAALKDEIQAIKEAEEALNKKNAENAEGARITAQEVEASKALTKLKIEQVKISKTISDQNKKAVELGFLAPELAMKGFEVDKSRLEIINQILKVEKELAANKAAKKLNVPDLKEIIIKPSKGQLSALREAASLIEENATATERLATFKQRLVGLMPDLIELTGSEAKASEVAANATANFAKNLEKVDETAKKATALAQGFGNAFSSAFEDAILKAESLSDVLKGLLKDIMRLVIRQSISIPISKAITGAFTGGKAGGGTINGPTLVGERGPEIFNPRGPGSILNNSASKSAMGGGQPVQITNEINVGPQNDTFAAVSVALAKAQETTMTAINNQRLGRAF